MGLKIEPLDSRKHNRASFCCGEASLDTYLRQQATQDLKKRVSTVFVLIDDPNMAVLGYYTLSAYTVDISALEQRFAKRLPRYPALPATLLGRLAVDSAQQARGFGELLLMDALRKSLAAALQVASVAVIAEALNATAASFYQQYGFQPFTQEPLKLYLPMQTIASLFPAPAR